MKQERIFLSSKRGSQARQCPLVPTECAKRWDSIDATVGGVQDFLHLLRRERRHIVVILDVDILELLCSCLPFGRQAVSREAICFRTSHNGAGWCSWEFTVTMV
jgi:hypothetical protein